MTDELTQLRTELAAERQDKHDALYRAHCRQEELHRKLAALEEDYSICKHSLDNAKVELAAVKAERDEWKLKALEFDGIDCTVSVELTELRQQLAALKTENEKMREKLSDVAAIAYCSGLLSLSDTDAMFIVRKVTRTHFDKNKTLEEYVAAIDAARKGGK